MSFFNLVSDVIGTFSDNLRFPIIYAILDKKDFISGNYLLEVSSPGIDRVLKKDKDFIKYAGSEVDVKCYSPLDDRKELKAFTAELRGLTEDGKIKLIYNEEELIVDKDKISQMRLHFSF